MTNNIKSKSRVLFPVNVRILQKSLSGQILTDQVVKNRVLKEYGLYSWVRFIIGDFYNGSLLDAGQYIPKYLAVGSNTSPLNGASNTSTAVKITDVSLYHELDDYQTTGEAQGKNRIKLNRANYIEDVKDEPWLKVQYEAYIPEDRYVNETIGEFALMTEETGWNAFARISGFEPFKKAPNTVVQVIWEITILSIESSTRLIPPIKTYLREAIEKAIKVLQEYPEDVLPDSRLYLEKLIEPATVANTGLYYLLNENEQITQEVINNYLSRPFVSVKNTGLIPLINKFDPTWKPTGNIVPPPKGGSVVLNFETLKYNETTDTYTVLDVEGNTHTFTPEYNDNNDIIYIVYDGDTKNKIEVLYDSDNNVVKIADSLIDLKE